MNSNYAAVVKQHLNKPLTTRFIVLVEEATWLLPIVVVFNKNGKLCICIDFKRINVTMKKDPYFLFFYRGGFGYGS
jgi:hypothetical protein